MTEITISCNDPEFAKDTEVLNSVVNKTLKAGELDILPNKALVIANLMHKSGITVSDLAEQFGLSLEKTKRFLKAGEKHSNYRIRDNDFQSMLPYINKFIYEVSNIIAEKAVKEEEDLDN